MRDANKVKGNRDGKRRKYREKKKREKEEIKERKMARRGTKNV